MSIQGQRWSNERSVFLKAHKSHIKIFAPKDSASGPFQEPKYNIPSWEGGGYYGNGKFLLRVFITVYYGLLRILQSFITNITEITEIAIMEYHGILRSVISPPPCYWEKTGAMRTFQPLRCHVWGRHYWNFGVNWRKKIEMPIKILVNTYGLVANPLIAYLCN